MGFWLTKVKEPSPPGANPGPLLVLCEGGRELQPPGCYPRRPGGQLSGVTPAPVTTELRQPGAGLEED